MTGDHRVDAALRALAELPVPEAPPHAETLRRRQLIGELERMQREAPENVPRRRRPRLGWAAAALAAVAAAAVVLATGAFQNPAPPKSAAQLNQPSKSEPTERAIALGSEVKTDAGSTVQLKTALGAKISVAGSSELRLAGGDASGVIERVELAKGSIQVKVPKLGAQRQFRVSTPDTLVIVHGTEFKVTVQTDASGRPNTVVEVTSGRVEVRRKQAVEFLNAGAAWSSGEGAADVAAGTKASTERGEAEVRELAKAASTPARQAASDRAEAPRSNLAQANALLASALEASRKGNDKLALARLDELLRRYPDSPVADNARVERFRTLRRLGREQEASRAAAKYLKGDPDGFARDEARELGK